VLLVTQMRDSLKSVEQTLHDKIARNDANLREKDEISIAASVSERDEAAKACACNWQWHAVVVASNPLQGTTQLPP
jgi:hypothetical protein